MDTQDSLGIRISADLKNALIELAKRDDRTLTSYLTRLITAHVESAGSDAQAAAKPRKKGKG